MPSLATIAVSFLLLAIFAASSFELRVIHVSVFFWATGGAYLRHFSDHHHTPRLARYFAATVFVHFGLLVAYSDLFYHEIVGRFFDLFFNRDPYDDEVPGSGFIEFCDIFWHRNSSFVYDLFSTLWLAVKVVFVAVVIPPAYLAWRRLSRESKKSDEWVATCQWIDRHPNSPTPPWVAVRQRLPPRPRRQTLYAESEQRRNFLRSTRIYGGDFDEAISRRRGLSKEFA